MFVTGHIRNLHILAKINSVLKAIKIQEFPQEMPPQRQSFDPTTQINFTRHTVLQELHSRCFFYLAIRNKSCARCPARCVLNPSLRYRRPRPSASEGSRVRPKQSLGRSIISLGLNKFIRICREKDKPAAPKQDSSPGTRPGKHVASNSWPRHPAATHDLTRPYIAGH